MTRRSFQPSVSTAGGSVCFHFNFRTVLYLQLLVHVFRITYCPGATVLSSADTGCTAVVPDGVRRTVSDDLNIVLLWEY